MTFTSMMLFGGLLFLVFWTVIIVGMVWLVITLIRNSQTGSVTAPSRPAPLDILKERYAKGEITKEQFEEIRRELGL
jgi:putative membrane protein